MNRANLLAFAAALLVACSAPAHSQDSPPNDAAWSRAVDLMPLIDPAKDAVKGEWKMEGGKLISDKSRQAKVQIPFESPDEYDFRIVFTCSEGMRTVCQYVSHQSRCAFWIMGGASTFLFPGVDGKRMEKDPKTAQGDRRLEFNRQYTCVLQVRNGGVGIYVDGEFINRWVTDYSDARLFSTWEIPNHRCLAVGCDGTATTFHKIEVLEISGKGKAGARPGRSAAIVIPSAPPPSAGSTLTTSTGVELVWIPPGEFMMGSTPEERGNAKYEGDKPRRTRIRAGFWLGRTEMTVGQWKPFIDATGYVTDDEKRGESYARMSEGGMGMVKGANWKDPKFGFKPKDNDPVCCVSWKDASEFCKWLTEADKKANKLPEGMVYRLPTEAEWEYACRAGTQTKFWWGDRAQDGEGRLNWAGTADGFEYVSPVDHFGKRGRNGFGLADMLGNVREWCLDGFDGNGAHGELYDGNSSGCTVRGGHFNCPPESCRCAVRVPMSRSGSGCWNGFRVCCGVPGGSGELSSSTALLVAVVPPAGLPPPPPTAPTAAKVTAPTALPPPPPVTPPPAPAKAMVATAPATPPPLRVVGVKQTSFEILNMATSQQYAYVNNAWIHNVSCIDVVLRVNEDIGRNPPNIKAYFYNKDRQLVKELPHPTSVSFGNRESFQSPDGFKPGRKYTVYFGISESIQRGKDKWKHVIVLFGNRENAAADIHPKEDINQFDFPEKNLVLKGMGR